MLAPVGVFQFGDAVPVVGLHGSGRLGGSDQVMASGAGQNNALVANYDPL